MDKKRITASWIDNVVGAFSPKAKANRLRYKYVNELLLRQYEGAAKTRRTEGFKSRGTSANTEIAISLATLRDRSRDLVRNNPYAARGIQAIANNVIGPGIFTQFKVKPDRRQLALNNMWQAWAGTKICDFDGRNTLAGIERIVTRSMVEGGEAIIRLRRVGRQFGIALDGNLIEVPPIQLQVLEGDHLASNQLIGKLESGNRIIQGIEFDSNNKRVAYHLFQDHPGSFNIAPVSNNLAFRIDAADIAHIYRQDRAGQIRGVPWLAPSMLRLKDFDDYEDAQLVRQKIAACFTAFVHDQEGLDDDLTEKDKTELGEKVEPGMIEFLPPGKEVTFATPPGTEGYEPYTSVVLHAISTGLGVPYAILTGNLTKVNFSSSRMGFIEFGRNIDTWRQDIIMPDLLWPVTNWFLTGVQILGVQTSGVVRKFTPPKREMVDPTKEVPALKDSVRSGFTTLSEAIRQSGKDPDQHFEELKRDNETLDKLNLTLDSDARTGQNGNTKDVSPPGGR